MSDDTTRRVVTAAAEVAKEMVTATGDLTRTATASMRGGTYDVDAYAADLTRLFALTVEGGLRVLSVAANPSPVASPPGQSPVRQPPADFGGVVVAVSAAGVERTLVVEQSFTRVGGGAVIPDTLIVLDPAPLPAGSTEFRVSVAAQGYASASYAGRVRIGPVEDGLVVDVDLDL